MHYARRFIPGVLAGAMLLGSTAGVFAAKNSANGQRAYAYGQVSNLSTSSFTLTWTPKKAGQAAAPKSVQVLLTSTTKEKARKGTTGALANGEYALVIGSKSASGISARGILYSTTPFRHFRNVVAGTVNLSASTPTSLVITTKAGKTLTFAITSATKYRVNQQLVTSPPALTNGEKVRVHFKRDAATKSLIARVISVRTAA
jgi:hypothetical protein